MSTPSSRRMVPTFAFSLLLGLLCAAELKAQDQDLPTVGPTDEMRLEQAIADMTVLESLGPEIQSQLLEESQRAQRHCESDMSLSNYYDCVCYAVTFLEARIDHGPEEDINFTLFVRNVDFKDCVDEPQIAKVNYQRCLRMISNTRFSPGQEEVVCQCVGRNVAERFADNPLSSPRQISKLFVDQIDHLPSWHAITAAPA